jgi:hypothetical protein
MPIGMIMIVCEISHQFSSATDELYTMQEFSMCGGRKEIWLYGVALVNASDACRPPYQGNEDVYCP